MVARCYPPEPKFQTASERDVWTALRKQSPDEAVLIHGQRFTGRDGDWEADLIVLWPSVGVTVIEVKGGSISYDQGRWIQRAGGAVKEIDPVDQSLSAKYLLRRYLEGHPAWKHGRTRYSHLVAFPYSSFADDFQAPDFPRW